MREPASRPVHLRPVPDLPDGHGSADGLDALVERARSGDIGAWERLYQAHFDSLFGLLRYLTGDAVVAEELAQETFAQAIASRARYDPRRPFGSWLHGIGLNVTRNHWRKQRNTASAHRRLAASTVDAFSPSDPHDEQMVRERSQILYEILSELPVRLREAFVLREMQGLSTREAGELLGISPGNVAVRATRARGKIRDALRRRGLVAEEETAR